MAETCQPISLEDARTLFLQGQQMLRPVNGEASGASVLRLIDSLGFVQLDSISIVERAHHHILWTRMHGYRPPLLHRLQRSGRVFEHWTHDASIIPSALFPHWRHRFDRVSWAQWLKSRLGPDGERVLRLVIDRVREDGPVMARDFEHSGGRSGPWWDWKPAKAALEFWWRRGELSIPRRDGFEKVYDLTERVLPKVWPLEMPAPEAHVDWACRTSLERLGVATPREIAAFWNAIPLAKAVAWCSAAAASGEIVPVRITSTTNGKAALSYAWADWRKRLARVKETPRGMRLLSPFDPLIRDRARALRLFNFDYRFEAFVPEAKRRYGYYVLPILDNGRLVGRLDPKLDRQAGVLRIRRVFWEAGVKPSRAKVAELEAAAARYAAFAGAERVEFSSPPRAGGDHARVVDSALWKPRS